VIMTEEDYCFDCKEWVAPGDSDHLEHDTIKNRTRPESPPDLGVSVSDGIGVRMDKGE
jgi:hypothetical protein